MLESVHIAANKNTVPGDVSAMVPGGIRMGKTASCYFGLVVVLSLNKFLSLNKLSLFIPLQFRNTGSYFTGIRRGGFC